VLPEYKISIFSLQ